MLKILVPYPSNVYEVGGPNPKGVVFSPCHKKFLGYFIEQVRFFIENKGGYGLKIWVLVKVQITRKFRNRWVTK
jgi:hypothetical protein